MDKTEKIKGMLKLLELNDDQYCYEMTSLATKINNFLDDRSRLLSGQWLSVIYTSLTEEDDGEIIETFAKMTVDTTAETPVEIDVEMPVGIDKYETVIMDADVPIDIDDIDVLDSIPGFEESRFALV